MSTAALQQPLALISAEAARLLEQALPRLIQRLITIALDPETPAETARRTVASLLKLTTPAPGSPAPGSPTSASPSAASSKPRSPELPRHQTPSTHLSPPAITTTQPPSYQNAARHHATTPPLLSLIAASLDPPASLSPLHETLARGPVTRQATR